MSLQECYSEHTGYFLSLQTKMNKHIAAMGLGVPNTDVIKAFCDTFGNLPLDTLEDYSRTLDKFQAFTAGISWAMKQ